ncbi:hypothetical protein FACS189487_11050 [Campylobacterota bacterium]|nr:hypothetical protein FACS189487_11050 [Campylobacterota bacterium]
MVIHICCAVDSWYFLAKIRGKYPSERLIGFFYNPNIYPESEYSARLIDAKRSCERQEIEFVEGDYDCDRFLALSAGKENEPERGKRCEMCFDMRLAKTAEFAQKRGENRFTTTLLLSPKKDLAQLTAAATDIAARYGAEFVCEDFRKGGGTQNAFAFARENNAYFQNYCGCAWALLKQRADQERFAPELSSPIYIRSLGAENPAQNPADQRLSVIKERYLREKNSDKNSKNIALIKHKVLNWRLLSALFADEKGVIACEIAPYSAKINARSRLIATAIDGVFRFEKEAGFVVESSAKVAKCVKDTKDTKCTKPTDTANIRIANITANTAANIRAALGLGAFDITPIFIIDRAAIGKVSAKIEAVFYEEEELSIGG